MKRSWARCAWPKSATSRAAAASKQVAKLRDYVDRALKKEIGKPPFVPDMLFGTGGTFTALASIIMARQGQAGQPMWGFRVTRAQIRHLVADLAQMSLEKRCKVPGLSPQRADIIVAGLAIIERIMRHLRVNVVQVHTRGVRDGLLLTMVDQAGSVGRRRRHSGVCLRQVAEERRAAVEEFAKNCGVDLPHARQVSRIAGSLWEQLAVPLGAQGGGSRADRVGRAGGERRLPHQLRRPPQAQLSLDPQQRAARLRAAAIAAAGERGPLPPRQSRPRRSTNNYRELSVDDQRRVAALAAILRLALALDRTHQQHVAEVRARVRDDGVQIIVQSHGDADVDVWAAERKVELFEKVFGRKVRFSARNGDARREWKTEPLGQELGTEPTSKRPASIKAFQYPWSRVVPDPGR